ncbi:MAG: antibiotic biosynthesis monooxygenase [Candidatus Limnocylindria bacterium]
MAAPFILITTHRVQDGQLDALEQLGQAFVASIEASEPDALGYQLYLNDEGTELTHVLIQRDSAAMDRHFQVSGELIGKSLELAETTAIYALGEPGPVLRQVLTRNAEAGIPVSIRPRRMGGLDRLAA